MSRPTACSRVGDFDEKLPRPLPSTQGSFPDCCCSNTPEIHTNSPSALYKYTSQPSGLPAGNLGNDPHDLEPGGTCTSYVPSFYESSGSTPSCVLWAKNFSCLLQDDEGIELFRRYLEREGQAHADALNFWFACEGLKKQPNKNLVVHLIKAIYRKFIISPTLAIREDLRREVMTRIRENLFDKGVFDSVQADVGKRITSTTYPNFLQSDIYLNYLQQIPQDYYSSSGSGLASGSGSGSGSSSSSNGRDFSSSNGPSSFLPTVLEDTELEVNTDSLPLTKDVLVATQIRRALEVRPKPEAYAGIYLQHGQPINTKVYSSYNPVSRQDSELQSLSSDPRTDSDAMSCTDNSVDGASTCPQKMTKRQHQRQLKAMKENASLNRDTTHLLIPRTQRIKESSCQLSTEEFSQQLIEKLETLKKKQEAQEKFNRKLMETEYDTEKTLPEKTLAEVIREKLQVEEQEDSDNQAILDQHVSRVWSDSTPSRSPRILSPKPKSPDGRRRLLASSGVPHPYQTKIGYNVRYPKKEKDVFSTFSADSGNIHDFTDVSESGRNFPKSKSFPDYADPQNAVTGYEGRLRNSREPNSRKLSNKKPASETTDSGVSVISDTVPCAGKHSTEWLFMRMKETCDRTNSRYKSIKQSCMSALVAHRHGKKGERSGSLERYSTQPLPIDSATVASSSRPNTATQLEEARRRLEQTKCIMEDDNKWKMNRMRPPVSNKGSVTAQDLSFSNQSTLRKYVKKSEPSHLLHRHSEQEYMTVMYSFWDEKVPYRTKVLGNQVTLKQFKDLLPRKGNFRYYFKTECAEVDTKTIHEEIFDDNQELPLWEGRLIAQVKPYD